MGRPVGDALTTYVGGSYSRQVPPAAGVHGPGSFTRRVVSFQFSFSVWLFHVLFLLQVSSVFLLFCLYFIGHCFTFGFLGFNFFLVELFSYVTIFFRFEHF
jgi:hypothetical protein